MRGRKPTPDAIRLLMGKPPRPGSELCPKFTEGANAPDWLDAYGRELFDSCAAELGQHGMLTVVDAEPLGSYCLAMSMIRSLSMVLNDPTTDPKERGASSRLLLKAQTLAKSLGQEFGFSPSSRTKLAVTIGTKDDLDEFLAETQTA